MLNKECDFTGCRFYDLETSSCGLPDSVFKSMVDNDDYDICIDGNDDYDFF